MSGGSFEYRYAQLDLLKDDIECTFLNEGKYRSSYDDIEGDHLEGCTETERNTDLREVEEI